MVVWFEGSGQIDAPLASIAADLSHFGEHCRGVLGHMPGLTTVKLVYAKSASISIQTNEGAMKRKRVSKHVEAERILLEFDEEYVAKGGITVHAHYVQEFTATEAGTHHHLVISNVQAPGLLGFFYRKFGNSRIGNAVLNSYQSYFDEPSDSS